MEELDEYLKIIAASYKAEIVEHGCNNLYKIKTSANKYGIIAGTLRTVCKPEYDEIYFHSCPYNNFQTEEFPFDYPFCIKIFQNGMKVVFNITGDGYGYVDLNNNFTRYSFHPSFAKELNCNYIWIGNQVVDINGQIILSIECESQLSCRYEGNLIVIGNVHAIIFPNKKIQIYKKGRSNMRLTQSLYPFVSVDRDLQNISYYKSIDNRNIYTLCENNMYSFVDENLNNYTSKYYDEICGVKVRSKNGWGRINERLEEIIPPRYTWIHEFISDWAYVGYNDYYSKIALRHINGKEINLFDYSFTNESLDNTFEDGLLLVCHREYGYGFIDEDGDEIIKCKYHSAEKFVNGLAKVRYDTEFGYINKKGELLIENGNKTFFLSPQYEWGWKCEYGYIKVQKNNLYGLLDESGKEIISCSYEKLEVLSDNEILVEKIFNDPNLYSKFLWKGHKSIIKQRLILNNKGYYVLNLNKSNMSLVMTQKYDWIYPFHDGIARIEKNGKWGFINQVGEEIVLFERDIKVSDFSYGLALIKRNNNSFYYINSTGNVVIDSDNLGLNDCFPYSFKDDYAIIIRNSKFGMIDKTGEIIIPTEYDYIGLYDKSIGLVKIGKTTKDGIKYGYSAINGNIVIPCKYKSINNITNRTDLFIASYGEQDENPFIPFGTAPFYKIINRNDEIVIPIAFHEIQIDNYLPTYYQKLTFSVYECDTSIEKGLEYGIKQMPYVFIISDKTIDGYCRKALVLIYKIGNTYMFAQADINLMSARQLSPLNIKGDIVYKGVAVVYNAVEFKDAKGCNSKSKSNFSLAHSEKLFDLIPLDKITTINPRFKISKEEFNRIVETVKSNHASEISIDINHKYSYVDKNNYEILPYKFDEALPFNEDLASVKKQNKWGCINLKGDIIIPYIYDEPLRFIDRVSTTKNKEKYGIINKNGIVLADTIYDEPLNFIDGISIIKSANKFGFIDNKGTVIADCIYDEVKNFSEEMAAVRINNLWGYIDKTGKQILDFKYREANNFSEGLALVSIDWKTDCFINKLGEIVISCKGMYDISNFQGGIASATIRVCRPGKDDIETFIRKGAREKNRF